MVTTNSRYFLFLSALLLVAPLSAKPSRFNTSTKIKRAFTMIVSTGVTLAAAGIFIYYFMTHPRKDGKTGFDNLKAQVQKTFLETLPKEQKDFFQQEHDKNFINLVKTKMDDLKKKQGRLEKLGNLFKKKEPAFAELSTEKAKEKAREIYVQFSPEDQADIADQLTQFEKTLRENFKTQWENFKKAAAAQLP